MSSPAPREPIRLAAVVLTGGTGMRLGGVDKASLEIDGLTLLERALAATVAAEEVVVVGARVETSRPVTWTRESPAGGGPAAGLLAGLDALAVRPDLVCVLAVDMPRVVPSTVARLMEALADDQAADAAVLVDEEGVRQTLAAVYRYDALGSARPGEREQEHGLSIRRLIASLRIVGVAAVGDEARDVDTWEDLRHLGG
ncbi:MAG TPA: NTP transferase domain-containing protein [Nocardioidaceae bacterium]|nr:NTP transferase domain-containing protein [Nocardioidaceae bacterium]